MASTSNSALTGAFIAKTLLVTFIGLGAILGVKTWGTVNKAPQPLCIVARESFALSIIERGVVIPARVSPIASQILSNQAKIVWLLKEGTQVRKGTLVGRFDAKPFMDNLQKAEQLLADNIATMAASEKFLSLQKEEEDGKIEEAKNKVEIAQIQADNIENGFGPLERKKKMQDKHQAERSLEIYRHELEDFEVLLQKGHVSIRERDKAADKVTTAQEQVQVTEAELKNFDNYSWPKMLREAELMVHSAHSNLQRVQRTAEIQLQNRVAEVEKNRRKVENGKTAYQAAKREVVNCDLYAPNNGILLYSELPRENGRRKIQIGDSVWVGQTFLQVPDTSDLVAEIRVREVDVAKISVGMLCEIQLDAFPGKTFPGQIESVASLAKEDSQNKHIRRFYTRIKFTGDTPGVHVGMSATATIIYTNVDDAVAIPIGAISYRAGQPFVKGERGEEITVTLGNRGIKWVEVLTGLQQGDSIIFEGSQ